MSCCPKYTTEKQMWINLLLQIDFNVQYAYYNGPKTLIHMKAVVSNFLLLLMLIPPYLASLSGNYNLSFCMDADVMRSHSKIRLCLS